MTILIGKKVGMTQIFTEAGAMVGVTAIETGPCPVLSVNASRVRIGFDPVKPERLAKPQRDFFAKIKVPARRVIREVPRADGVEYSVGQELKVDLFKAGDFVDVTGISKGKGFAGGMKRWHWAGGPNTHGHTSHRRIGSIGSTTTPGRVWKGHHLPGHMGAAQVTVSNLRVVKVIPEHNLLLVNGSVPGGKNSYLAVRSAKKKSSTAK